MNVNDIYSRQELVNIMIDGARAGVPSQVVEI
jgi:hypothetical protein